MQCVWEKDRNIKNIDNTLGDSLMKILIKILLLLVVSSQLYAYETNSMFYTIVPSDLAFKQFEFTISHRFQGKFNEDPFDNFFGMHGGASVAVGFRAGIPYHLEVGWHYLYYNREMNFDVAKNIDLTWHLKSKIFYQFDSFRPVFYLEEREKSNDIGIALERSFLNNKLTPVLNLQYDGYYKNMGTCIGIDYQVTKKIGFFAEYFPRRDNDDDTYSKNAILYGLRLNTYGHRFLLTVSNSRETGLRHVMRGADTGDLYFGFSIHRLLEIY